MIVVRGLLAMLVGAATVAGVPPKRVRVADVFDIVWTGAEPLSLREVKEKDGQVVMTLANDSGAVVDGFQIASSPPPEGGCKGITHPFANEKGVGRYAQRLHRSPDGTVGPAGEPVVLNLAPGGTVVFRISAAEMEAWTKRRRLLRCAPRTPSLIALERVCLRDKAEWTPAGWNVIRTPWCQGPSKGQAGR